MLRNESTFFIVIPSNPFINMLELDKERSIASNDLDFHELQLYHQVLRW
jgi:hypothetical protein